MFNSILVRGSIKRVFVASLLFLPSVLTADANTAFTIAAGNKKQSGCDKYKKDLPGYIQEAFDMAQSGLDTIDSLLNRQGTYSDAYLFTML